MKKILLLILLSTITLSFAEESEDLSHYIGAAAGVSTGYGLSYRYWPENYGSQIVFTPITNGSNIIINLGTALVKTMYQTTYTRLFLFVAGNITYINGEDYLDKTVRAQEIEGAIGIGPGLEIYIFKNIALDIMFGYKYGFAGDFEGLGFTGEVALYYRF